MDIYLDLKEVKEGDIEYIDGIALDQGGYLSIKTSSKQNNKPILIPYKDFEEIYSRSKIATTTEPADPGISKEFSPVVAKKSLPNLKPVISFLNTKIGFSKDNFADDKKKLKVQSSSQLILELPWEDIIEEDLFIIREIVCPERKYDHKTRNNILILMSHAHEGTDDNIQELVKEEVESIYKTLHSNAQNNFWVDNILISRHTSIETIKALPWKDFNFAHLVMHGDSNGYLCLENFNPENFKSIDRFSTNDFLDLIKDNCLNLIFLSMCYSGGGIDKESLAFQIVRSGYSKYVIGYSYPVGEKSAKDFANIFYQKLATSKTDIEEIYTTSLESYYQSGKKKFIPLLYSSV